MVEEVGEGVSACGRRPRRPPVGSVPGAHSRSASRPADLCGRWPKMLAGGLLDRTTRLSFGGALCHHYCFLSSFAGGGGGGSARASYSRRRALRRGRARGLRRGERRARRGRPACARGAGCRFGGGTGLAAVIGSVGCGARPEIVAVDARESRLARRRELGVTSTVVRHGTAADVAARRARGERRRRRLRLRGRRPAVAAEAAFLDRRPWRGGAVRHPAR